MKSLPWIAAALSLAACAPIDEIASRDTRRNDAVTDTNTDTGVRVDSGVAMDSSRDTGVIVDTGVTVDTGVIVDTGVTIDSGVVVDTGVSIDTGVIVDTGVVVDAGVIVDTGVRVDTGVIVDTGVPVPGTSPAGGPCASNADCITGLRCDTTVLGGFCFGDCINNASQVEEQRQCFGSRSTCLTSGDFPDEQSMCTAACRPGPAPGCRAGQVCTGLWLSHAVGTDAAGCLPFCSSNAHCRAGEVCNVRTGECGATGSSPTALADGSLCTIPGMGAPSPCRGTCFRVVSFGSQGICGSSIDMALTSACPDGPSTPLLSLANDNLGYCVFRSCTATACCPAGMVCEGTGGTGFCSVDDPMQPNIACR